MITWHAITKLGGNAYQNERVSLLLFTWPNDSKVIKATAPKLALMEGTHSFPTGHEIFGYVIFWQTKSINSQLLQTLEGIKFERQKSTIKCIYSPGSKIRLFWVDGGDHREAKKCWNISSLSLIFDVRGSSSNLSLV